MLKVIDLNKLISKKAGEKISGKKEELIAPEDATANAENVQYSNC